MNVNANYILYKVGVFVSLTAGELSGGGEVHPDHCDVNPVLSTDLQSLGLPGRTELGAQVTHTHQRKPQNRHSLLSLTPRSGFCSVCVLQRYSGEKRLGGIA